MAVRLGGRTDQETTRLILPYRVFEGDIVLANPSHRPYAIRPIEAVVQAFQGGIGDRHILLHFSHMSSGKYLLGT